MRLQPILEEKLLHGSITLLHHAAPSRRLDECGCDTTSLCAGGNLKKYKNIKNLVCRQRKKESVSFGQSGSSSQIIKNIKKVTLNCRDECATVAGLFFLINTNASTINFSGL